MQAFLKYEVWPGCVPMNFQKLCDVLLVEETTCLAVLEEEFLTTANHYVRQFTKHQLVLTSFSVFQTLDRS